MEAQVDLMYHTVGLRHKVVLQWAVGEEGQLLEKFDKRVKGPVGTVWQQVLAPLSASQMDSPNSGLPVVERSSYSEKRRQDFLLLMMPEEVLVLGQMGQ